MITRITTLWFKKNEPTLADYNYEPVQSILIIFSKLFLNDHKSCLVVKFFTSPHIMLPLYLVKHNALFCTNYTAYRKKYVFSSGGSEKNRLITGADVRTGDHAHARSRAVHWSTASSTTHCGMLAHVSMRRFFKSIVSRTGVLYRRCCIRPQMR